MPFHNREDAGRRLAEKLLPYQREDCLILALPRGGAPVGHEIAHRLKKPWDVLVVRKIGAPNQQELAVGAIGPGNVVVWNQEILDYLQLRPEQMAAQIQRETMELNRRLILFRGDRPFPALNGKTVIIVDDGLATGATARAAIQTVKALHPAKTILAVPVGARSTVSELRPKVDELICLEAPEYFEAVSQWYEKFPQTTDQEVVALLQKNTYAQTRTQS